MSGLEHLAAYARMPAHLRRPEVDEYLAYKVVGQNNFPPGSTGGGGDGAGYLYVIQFENHIVKPGYTANPKSRFSQHLADGRNLDRLPIRGWLSGLHTEAKTNEASLVTRCLEETGAPRRKGRRREYFMGSFNWVVEIAKGFPMNLDAGAASDPVMFWFPDRGQIPLVWDMPDLDAYRS